MPPETIVSLFQSEWVNLG